MSMLWDEDKQCYRKSLPYKVFYVWGWPTIRWTMFHLMPSERAHIFALHWGIPTIGTIERAWRTLISAFFIAAVLFLFCVSKLPGFSWNDKKPDMEQPNKGQPQ